jgi:hypothetical protein
MDVGGGEMTLHKINPPLVEGTNNDYQVTRY